MNSHDLSRATWKKARRSSANGQCVEVAILDSDSTAVRDSKQPDGPVLIVSPGEWAAFIERVKLGDFD